MEQPIIGLYPRSRAADLRLDIDYSFNDVPNPFAINKIKNLPVGFIKNFKIKHAAGNELADCIPNGLGWYIVSARIVEILKEASNVADLNFIPLPTSVGVIHRELPKYSVLGITRRIECLDRASSQVRWAKGDKQEFVESIFKGVLRASQIPTNCDAFHLKEYPVVPILRRHVAAKIVALSPTGLECREFGVSGTPSPS
jgi:hypothetical protein